MHKPLHKTARHLLARGVWLGIPLAAAALTIGTAPARAAAAPGRVVAQAEPGAEPAEEPAAAEPAASDVTIPAAPEPAPAAESEPIAAPTETVSAAPAETYAPAPAPAATAADEGEDEDDDWDTAGPVDTTPRISGAMMASFRSTFYDSHALPDGTRIEDYTSFQLEHTHIKFSGDITESLSWEIMPCLTHMNDLSILTANFTYQLWPELQVTFGRFLLPFGQFNQRSLPGSYGTVSRPLLYSSHEDRPVKFDYVPSGLLFTPRDSLGINAAGNLWFGPDDIIQVSYSAYVTNGLRGASNQMSRFWDDNNKHKQYGGRLNVAYNGGSLSASLGGSFLYNKWDKNLDQYAGGGDLVLSYTYSQGKRITVRGEYTTMVRDIIPTTELARGDEGLSGAYISAEGDITDWLGLYYQWDTLSERTPIAQLNEGIQDRTVTINRHAGGAKLILGGHIEFRAEYAIWLLPLGLPDSNRLSFQTVVTF